MGIRMVRQPSQTPNVTNIDDIIPFRYAYGDQNGYVIGKGNEISHTIDGSTFRINSGRVVLQGVETDIDANGVSFTIDNASETRYFVVYYEVNLATQTTAIKLSTYSTSGYPTIDAGDDLTANSSGIARLPLYRFTATGGVISNVSKVAKAIEYSGTALVGYDISKGTVEERLTRLGFKQDTLILGSAFEQNGSVEKNSIIRLGNLVVIEFLYNVRIEDPSGDYSIYVPEDFYPNQEIISGISFNLGINDNFTKEYELGSVKIEIDGKLTRQFVGFGGFRMVTIGSTINYEAKPL